jgi:hypothetical protein
MNERIKQLAEQADDYADTYCDTIALSYSNWNTIRDEKFAELIVQECVNREELLGAIARGWCSEKNQHKTMDSDLALAIFDEVERQIKQQFGVDN